MTRLVFIDVDDTLLSPPYAAVRRVARVFGRSFPTEHEFINRKSIHFYEAFPQVFRSAKQMWLFALLSLPFGYFRSQKALQTNPESLTNVLKDHRVYLLSKNPPAFTRWRLKRIKYLFKAHVGDRYIACGPMFKKGPTKLAIIQNVASQRGVPLAHCLLIDDSTDNIMEAAAAGVQTALVRSAWNQTSTTLPVEQQGTRLAIDAEQVAPVATKFFQGGLEKEGNLTLITPPFSFSNMWNLSIFFVRRFWLYSETPTCFKSVVPVARNCWTSYLYKDPHGAICSRLSALRRDPDASYGVRVVCFKKGEGAAQLPVDATKHLLEMDERDAVRYLRKTCRDLLISRGCKLVLESYFYFESLLREKEIDRILHSIRLKSAADAFASSHGVSVEDAYKKARKYAVSICAHRTYVGCVATHLVLKLVMRLIFRKIEIQVHPEIRKLESTHFLVYASAHRSYLDSGILFATLAQNSMFFPYMVAADKMRDIWIGKLGTICGALFLQRKFVDVMYAAILAEHIDCMQRRGASLEVFLEGQRSRSGLTLAPKRGIASIIWNNISSEPANMSNVAIVPVSFSYNKLPESELLIKESYDERSKIGAVSLRETADIKIKKMRKKTKLQTLRGLYRRLLSKKVSECHIVFSAPITMQRPVLQGPADDAAGLQGILNRTMLSINANTISLPSSILCFGVLSAADNHLSRANALSWLDLSKQILGLYDPVQARTPFLLDDDGLYIDDFLRLPFINRKFKRYQVAERDVLAISGLDAQRAHYYRNNVLHFYVLPALLSFVLVDTATGRKNELHRFFDQIFASLQVKYFLPPIKSAARFIDELLDLFVDLGMVDVKDGRYNTALSTNKESLLLMLSRVGSELFEDDLASVLLSLRRSYKRIATNIPCRLAFISSASFIGEVVALTDKSFYLICDAPLEEKDKLVFTPQAESSSNLQLTVVGREQEGILVSLSDTAVESPNIADIREEKDKRIATKTGVPGSFTYTKTLETAGMITSLSISGAFIETQELFAEGDTLRCDLDSDEKTFVVTGDVSRVSNSGIGLRFQDLRAETNAQLLTLLARLDTSAAVDVKVDSKSVSN